MQSTFASDSRANATLRILRALWDRTRAAAGSHARLIATVGLSAFVMGSVWAFTNAYLAEDARLGVARFETSCGWRSQHEFVVATSLLHLFQFADAEDAYRQIVAHDPNCAIAYWGIAMSRLGDPLYRFPSADEVAVARRALATGAMATEAGARERGYLIAARVLFAPDPPDWPSRLAAYARAMREVVESYPHDIEATIFYALALNLSDPPSASLQTGRTKAAELLLQAFSEEPDHPGITHYLTFCLGHLRYQPKPFGRVTMAKSQLRMVLAVFAMVSVLAIGTFVIFTSDLWPGVASGTRGIGGPFALRASDGSVVTDRTFGGRWMLVYFGYTQCPYICPTTMVYISRALTKLGTVAQGVQPIFISIDPERDTPKIADEYVKSFDPRIIGLSGKPDEIAQVAKEYRVFYRKAPIAGTSDYFMEHSSYVYVMNDKGRYVTLVTHDQLEDSLNQTVARLQQLLAAAPARGDPSESARADTTVVPVAR